MSCPGCHGHASPSSQYICSHCLSKLQRLSRSKQQSLDNNALPLLRNKANAATAVLKDHATATYRKWSKQQSVNHLRDEVARLKSVAEADQQSIDAKRAYLTARKQRLQLAREALYAQTSGQHGGPRLRGISPLHTDDERLRTARAGVNEELVQTRRVLLQELKEAFNVYQAEDGAWHIAWLPASTLAELQQLPQKQLNATLLVLVRFMLLIAFYLGLRLPFVMRDNHARPLISPARGTICPSEYMRAHPLYMSSGAASSDKSSSRDSASQDAVDGPAQPAATSASHASALAIGMKMLLYNAAYLWHICRPDEAADPFPQSRREAPFEDNILSLLAKVCDSPAAGSKSHIWTADTGLLNESAIEGVDFAAFLDQYDAHATVDTRQGPSTKKAGTYVLIGSPEGRLSSLDKQASASRSGSPDDWDLVQH